MPKIWLTTLICDAAKLMQLASYIHNNVKYKASIKATNHIKDNTRFSGCFNQFRLNYHKIDEHELAIKHLKKAHQLAPNNLDAISNLSAVYNDLNHFLEAYQIAKPAIESGKVNVNIMQNFIKICIDMGYAKEALKWSLELVRQRPNVYESISSATLNASCQ